MFVVGGSASQLLSKELAKSLRAKLAKVEIKRFPDDECYVRIDEDLDDQEVFLVQTSWPDRNIVELFLLQDAIKEFDVDSLTTVVPYFGYARQDKQFKPGEPISARAIARLIQMNTDEFITVDVHAPSVTDWFEGKSAKNVAAYPEIGKFLKGKRIELILSPDEGRADNAKRVADVVNCEADFLVKERLDGETVKMTPKRLDANGKKVAVVDDIISTGITIIKAAEQLRKQGAAKIYAVCTHGVFAGNAIPKLEAVCDEVCTTDTIENPKTCISVAPQIAKIARD
ncbi:MAG: ribose-phosphate diphosphokinase [Thermoplasmatota archaeon]|nr:ribose-phosphate diphosphokinase [Candidatus Thermoplasmatota archaeon]MBU1913641.1 ribose-phosphate diphosphokinase [Candidatus Thermoplasmatota archaeon]